MRICSLHHLLRSIITLEQELSWRSSRNMQRSIEDYDIAKAHVPKVSTPIYERGDSDVDEKKDHITLDNADESSLGVAEEGDYPTSQQRNNYTHFTVYLELYLGPLIQLPLLSFANVSATMARQLFVSQSAVLD